MMVYLFMAIDPACTCGIEWNDMAGTLLMEAAG